MSPILRMLRLAVLSTLLASTLLLSADRVMANHNDQHQTGPQQIALEACNEGAANARTNLASDHPARDAVPHFHTFTEGQTRCYHANPTYPHSRSGVSAS